MFPNIIQTLAQTASTYLSDVPSFVQANVEPLTGAALAALPVLQTWIEQNPMQTGLYVGGVSAVSVQAFVNHIRVGGRYGEQPDIEGDSSEGTMTLSGDAASSDATLGNAASNNATLGNAASNNATSSHATLGNAASNNATSSHETSSDTASSSAAPPDEDASKVAAPKAASPGVDSSTAASLEPASLNADSSKADSPDVDSPKAAAPKAASPDVDSSSVASLEPASSKAAAPEAAAPEAAALKASSPKAAAPEAAAPETAAPEAAAPEAAAPEAAAPEAAAPKAATPKADSSKAASPDVASSSAVSLQLPVASPALALSAPDVSTPSSTYQSSKSPQGQHIVETPAKRQVNGLWAQAASPEDVLDQEEMRDNEMYEDVGGARTKENVSSGCKRKKITPSLSQQIAPFLSQYSSPVSETETPVWKTREFLDHLKNTGWEEKTKSKKATKFSRGSKKVRWEHPRVDSARNQLDGPKAVYQYLNMIQSGDSKRRKLS